MFVDNDNLSKKNEDLALINKIKSISIEKKACIFIFSMGLIGAVVGAIDAEIASKKCFKAENCISSNSVETKIRKVSTGACAGAIAASFLSLSAIADVRSD